MPSAWYRALALFAAYAAVFAGSYVAAFALRFDFSIPPSFARTLWSGWVLAVGIKLVMMLVFRQYNVIVGHFGLPDLWRVVNAMLASSAILIVVYYAASQNPNLRDLCVPRGVLLIDFLVSTGGVVALRIGLRVLRERFRPVHGRVSSTARRVGIIGAGDVGSTLAKELLARRGLGLYPVVFFDDDPGKHGSRLHGIPVVGKPEMLADPAFKANLDEVIIAMPSAPARRIGEVVRLLQQVHLKFESVPSMDQLATGKVRVTQLRPIEIQDLLQREPVRLDIGSIRDQFQARTIMVTGAGGSIGRELCRQVLEYNPERVLMVEQCEVQLFQVQQELADLGYEGLAVPLIGDVADTTRMREILQRFRPAVIFHAAAHKHVPMMEFQPSEALKNNTFATARLADLARDLGVKLFVLISTDKAVNPTSVMGVSKRLAEIYIQAIAMSQPNSTKFMAVRFGNVLGSSGSVIPIFRNQIARGGPVTVTHPEVTRYFMTVSEAVGLVLQAASMGQGGEIFVLDMGKPVKILDLARQLIELSGLEPGEDIDITFTGLRPGEKLFEEVSHRRENHEPTTHPKVMRFVSKARSLEQVRADFADLESYLESAEPNKLKLKIKQLVPEYSPHLV